MNVKIGGLEITNVTPEDLDGLIKKYGKLSLDHAAPKSAARAAAQGEHKGAGLPVDSVVLKRLVEAGNQGVTTNDLGELLGRKGKATRGALKEWAVRVGLAADSFEDCRVGTSRGVRIRPNLLEVAKLL